MSVNIQEIWNKTLVIIKTELTEVSFNTWLKTLEPVAIQNNNFVLLVPNKFNKEILETRYLGLIANAIKQITSREYELEFILPENTHALEQQEKRNSKTFDLFEAPRLNPKYVSENTLSVIVIDLHMQHPWQLLRHRQKHIILSLYMEELV